MVVRSTRAGDAVTWVRDGGHGWVRQPPLPPSVAAVTGQGLVVTGPGTYMGYRIAAGPLGGGVPAGAAMRVRDGSLTGPVLDVVSSGANWPLRAEGGPQAFTLGLFVEVLSGTPTGFLRFVPGSEGPASLGTSPLFTASGLAVTGAGTLTGIRVANRGAGLAEIQVRAGGASGLILEAVTLLAAPNSSRFDDWEMNFAAGVYVEVVTGSVEGVLTYSRPT